ncbi:MAG: hypothetical protein WC556_00675 [Candidatus Methanoperedens sp.]
MKKSILFVLLLLFIPLAQAVPPVTSYWGYVTYNSVPLSNALVTVIDSTGKTVAGSTSNQDGTYTVNVLWDDLSTAADEGVISGESLTFEVNRETATTTTIGLQGDSLRFDLAASSSGSTPTPIPTPTKPTEIPLPINATTGIVNTTVIVAAPSANILLTIPNGTRVGDANGNPLTPKTNLSIITAWGITTNENSALSDKLLLGPVVDLRPNGTRFDTPIQIRFDYTPTSDVDENSLIVKYFNTASNVWEEMQTVERNTAQHYVIANISHFSTFALVGTPTSSTTSSGGSSGGSGGGTYPSGYTSTGAAATAVKTAIATATPVVVKTEVPVATTAKPEATETTKEPASEPTTPGFGAIIAVFAIAMIASLLKNNRNRR